MVEALKGDLGYETSREPWSQSIYMFIFSLLQHVNIQQKLTLLCCVVLITVNPICLSRENRVFTVGLAFFFLKYSHVACSFNNT